MGQMYKKKAGIGILILPGFGRVTDSTILVGEHFAKFVPDLLEIYEPEAPAPAVEVAVDVAIPGADATVVGVSKADEVKLEFQVDVGDLSDKRALELIDEVKTPLEEKAEEPAAPKAEKKSKGKK